MALEGPFRSQPTILAQWQETHIPLPSSGICHLNCIFSEMYKVDSFQKVQGGGGNCLSCQSFHNQKSYRDSTVVAFVLVSVLVTVPSGSSVSSSSCDPLQSPSPSPPPSHFGSPPFSPPHFGRPVILADQGGDFCCVMRARVSCRHEVGCRFPLKSTNLVIWRKTT